MCYICAKQLITIMRKLFTLCLIAMAMMFSAPSASAYSKEMAEFAKLLNDELATEGVTATYEDPNLVFSFPETYFDAEEVSAFASLSAEEMQELKVPLVESILGEMDKETSNFIAEFLQNHDAKLIIRLHIKGQKKEIAVNPKELKQ